MSTARSNERDSMKKILSIITAISFVSFPFSVFAAPPTYPAQTEVHADSGHALTTTIAVTVPVGSNQLYLVTGFYSAGSMSGNTITLNGASLTIVDVACAGYNPLQNYTFYAYVTAPTTGNLVVTDNGLNRVLFSGKTVNDAAQTSSISSANCTSGRSQNLAATTTPAADSLLFSMAFAGAGALNNHGAGQTEYINFDDDANLADFYGSYVTGSTTASVSQGMSEFSTGTNTFEAGIVAIAPVGGGGGGAAATQYPNFIMFGF